MSTTKIFFSSEQFYGGICGIASKSSVELPSMLHFFFLVILWDRHFNNTNNQSTLLLLSTKRLKWGILEEICICSIAV